MGDINDSAIFSEIDPSNNTINSPSWAEGMLPSLVNDNGRALQGAIKRFRDWLCGAATVGGTANAITLTYPQSPTLLVKGDRYVFFPTADNTGPTTLTVGNLAIKAIQRNGAPLFGGEMKTGIPVEVVYDDVQFQLFRLGENFLALTGPGQASASWSTTGNKGGSISLLDTGVAVGNGGAVEFGAAGGTWRFAAIKGFVVNGSGNSAGDLVFDTRTNVTDGVLSEKVRIAASGLVSIQNNLNVGGGVAANSITSITNIFANGNITTNTMNAVNIAASNNLNCNNFGAAGQISGNTVIANGITSNGAIVAAGGISATTVNSNNNLYSQNFAIAVHGGPYTVLFDGAQNQSLFLGSGGDPTNYLRNNQTVIQAVAGADTFATFNSFGTTTKNLSVAGAGAFGGGLTAASATVNSFVANGGGTPIFAPNGSIQAAGNVVASGSLISGGASTVGGFLQVNNGATVLGTLNTNALGVTGNATISGQALCGEVFSVGPVRISGDPNFYLFNTGPIKVQQFASQWFWGWNTGTGDLNWFAGGLGDHTLFHPDGRVLIQKNGLISNGEIHSTQNMFAPNFIQSSDRRIKQDIVPALEGLDTLLNLNPVTFKRIHKPKRNRFVRPNGEEVEITFPEPETEIGFIAQEVRKILPMAVTEIRDDMLPDENGEDTPSLSMSYTALIPVMVNGFKEIHDRLSKLESRPKAKTAKVNN